jgi:hypothetical protein
MVFPFLFFPLLWLRCAPTFTLIEGNRYRDPAGYFEFLYPEGNWTLLSYKNVGLVLWKPQQGATIVVNATPLNRDLDVYNLTRHLLIAFERKRIISQDTIEVNGRVALKTVLVAWVEKTQIKAEAYVVKSEGVVYDILLWSPLEVFSDNVELFHQFLTGISFLHHKEPH